MDEPYKTLVRQIRERVRKFMQRTDTRDLNLLVQNLEDRGCRVALFGGTIRDLMLQRAPRYPRDIDLVVEAEDVDRFLPLLMQAVVRRTRFGGFHLYMSRYMVDVWCLRDTWGFRHIAEPPTFSTLPLTTFLNAEAIAVELNSSTSSGKGVFDSGFMSAVSNRTLEINLAENPYPELCAVRSVYLARRTGFRLGSRLSDFIRMVLVNSSFDSLLRVQQHHYGNVILNRADLQRLQTLFVETEGVVELPLNLPTQWHLPFDDSNCYFEDVASSIKCANPDFGPAIPRGHRGCL